MNIMKYLVSFFSSLILLLIWSPSIVLAVDQAVVCPSGSFNVLCTLTTRNIGSVVSNILTFAFFAAVIIALGFLIYGGLKWIVSGGEKAAVEEARNHIIAALIGLVVVFLSYFIINIVVSFFLGKPLTGIELPNINQP